MPIIRSNNPWGKVGGLEAQRSDLWLLDLEPVNRFLASTAPDLKPLLPVDSRHYPRSVQFPEDRMDVRPVMRGTNKFNMPDYDQPLGEIRVDFLFDQPQATIQGTQMVPSPGTPASRIYTLLHAWRELARVGRGPRSSFSKDIVELQERYETLGLATDAGVQNVTRTSGLGSLAGRFDINVLLLRGSMNQLISSYDQDIRALEISSSHRLVQCWCAAVQFGQLSYVDSNLFTVTASLYAEEKVPVRFNAQVVLGEQQTVGVVP